MRDGQNNLKTAEIVTIGTEILLGDLVDTNTAWLSERLATLGVGIYRHTTVGDNRARIAAALEEAAARADLVITTGGLGPTSDDLTNECLAAIDRKSTRLNSSHANISYAVFCLKKKKKK